MPRTLKAMVLLISAVIGLSVSEGDCIRFARRNTVMVAAQTALRFLARFLPLVRLVKSGERVFT